MTTSFNDWVTLRKLVPSNNNSKLSYSLSLRCTDATCRNTDSGHVDFGFKALYSKYNPYSVYKDSVNDFNTKKVISFPSFFTAYRAWVETDKSTLLGHNIAVEPSGGSLGGTKVHLILVSHLPKELTMTTFVTRFVRYPGLLFVDARPRENCAILGYSQQSSAERACAEVVKVKVDGKELTVVVEALEKRPPMSVPSVLKAIEMGKLKKLTETKSVVPREEKAPIAKGSVGSSRSGNSIDFDEIPAHRQLSGNISNICDKLPKFGSKSGRNVKQDDYDEIPAHESNRTSQGAPQNIANQNNRTKARSSSVSKNGKTSKKNEHLFGINNRQYREMFLATCGSEAPRWGDAIPEIQIIKFIIVNQPDPLRFWAWLWDDDGRSARDLVELEKYTTHTAQNTPVPETMPKKGERGIGLYENNKWFRCYILNVDTHDNLLNLYFCDYGHSVDVPKEHFRYTAKLVWNLPPQAIPLKLYGYSLTSSYDPNDVQTIALLRGNVFKACVKSASSTSHVLHISNVTLDQSDVTIDDDIIGSCGAHIKKHRSRTKDKCPNNESPCSSVVTLRDSDTGTVEASPSCIETPPSLYDYHAENLQMALLTDVCDQNLFYLRTNFETDLQIKLDQLGPDLVSSRNFAVEDIALLCTSTVNHRVAVLQVSTALNKLKVLHVDHGIVEWVSSEDVYELPIRLMRDPPFQATAATLAGVVCVEERIEEAVVFMKSKVKSMVRMNFLGNRDVVGRVACVELFDPDTNESLNLEMVQRGLATTEKNIEMEDLESLDLPATDTFASVADRFQDLDIRSVLLETGLNGGRETQADMEVASCMALPGSDSDLTKNFKRRKETRSSNAKDTQQQRQQQEQQQPQKQLPQQQQHQQEQQLNQQHQQPQQQQQQQQQPRQRRYRQRKQQKQQQLQQQQLDDIGTLLHKQLPPQQDQKSPQTFASQDYRKGGEINPKRQHASGQSRKVYKLQDNRLAVNVCNVPPPPDIVTSSKVKNDHKGDNFEYLSRLVRGRGKSMS